MQEVPEIRAERHARVRSICPADHRGCGGGGTHILAPSGSSRILNIYVCSSGGGQASVLMVLSFEVVLYKGVGL